MFGIGFDHPQHAVEMGLFSGGAMSSVLYIISAYFQQNGSGKVAVLASIVFIFGTSLFFVDIIFNDYNYYFLSVWSLIISFGLFGVSAVLYTALKLNVIGDGQNNSIDNDVYIRISEIEDKIDNIRSRNLQFNRINNSTLKVIDESINKIFQEKIKNNLREIIDSNVIDITNDSIIKNYDPDIVKERLFENLSIRIDKYSEGIADQIISQRVAGSQNLIWGIIFALSGLIAMAIMLLWPAFDSSKINNIPQYDWGYFLQTFIPKLSFVIIFESVSFFFLRAYADDRNMLKYLRNELTNVELKGVALLGSVYIGDEKSANSILDRLMQTERNFVLKKGDRIAAEVLFKENSIFVEDIIRNIVDKAKLKVGN